MRKFCATCNKERLHHDGCCIVCLALYQDEELRHLLLRESNEVQSPQTEIDTLSSQK